MTATLFDEQAELAILGAILTRNQAFDDVADVLEPEHFGRDHHRLTFAAMRTLHLAGQPVDPITLSAELERHNHLETVTRPFLYRLGDGVPRVMNIASYANVVRDKALLRSLRESARKVLTDADAANAHGAAVLEEAEQALFRLSATSVKGDWVSAAELTAELYPVIEQLANSGKPLTGLATGFPELDRLTRGFQDGDLILLGARPSMGKTALALQMAMRAAETVPVAFLSIEMARHPLGMRAVIAAAQVDGWRFLSGRLSEVDMQRVGEGLSKLGELALFIDESPQLSPLGVRAKLRRLKSRAGRLGLVVIDYLQLMAPLNEHRHENKTNQVAGISRALKILAREFGVPFLVLSQLNRGLERSADKTPSMADLRDSGALEQDADVVLLLHRAEVYDSKPENAGQADLIVGKQRNGPIGSVGLVFQKAQMRFESRYA